MKSVEMLCDINPSVWRIWKLANFHTEELQSGDNRDVVLQKDDEYIIKRIPSFFFVLSFLVEMISNEKNTCAYDQKEIFGISGTQNKEQVIEEFDT